MMNKVQCDSCGNFYSEEDIDPDDGEWLCRECEQEEWEDDDD